MRLNSLFSIEKIMKSIDKYSVKQKQNFLADKQNI